MSLIFRFVLATLIGLVIAGITHLVIVLSAPQRATHSAFRTIERLAPPGRTVLISSTDIDGWPLRADPNVVLAACMYDLSRGPVRVFSEKGTFFQSLSLHDSDGTVVFSITDRAAIAGKLDVVTALTDDVERLKLRDSQKRDDLTRDVIIASPKPRGFAVLRIFQPYSTMDQAIKSLAQSLACVPEAR